MHGLGNSSEFHRHFIVLNRRFIGIYRYFSVGVLFIDIVVPECRYLSVLECHCEQRVVDEGSRVGEELEGVRLQGRRDSLRPDADEQNRRGAVQPVPVVEPVKRQNRRVAVQPVPAVEPVERSGALSVLRARKRRVPILKPTACVEVIDILHSVFRVVTLLMSVKPVGAASAEHMPVETASFP